MRRGQGGERMSVEPFERFFVSEVVCLFVSSTTLFFYKKKVYQKLSNLFRVLCAFLHVSSQ